MAGILDYTRFIDIFTTTEDVKHTFPRDQYKYTYDVAGAGANGWTSTLTWMTLVVDSVSFDANKEPDFANSTVIGYFVGGAATQGSSGTMSFPANMYTGPILPGFERNIPITAVNITWTKGAQQFQKQLLLIQNWEPGTEIGDPTLDDNFIPIQATTSDLTLFLDVGPVLFGENIGFTAQTTLPADIAELGLARFYIQQVGDDKLIGSAPFVGNVARLSTATDYGTGDPRNISSGTYTVYAIRPGRREYVQSISNNVSQVVLQGVPLNVSITNTPNPVNVNAVFTATVTATTATGYFETTGPITNTATFTLIPNARTSGSTSTTTTNFVAGRFDVNYLSGLPDNYLDTTLTTSSTYSTISSTFTGDVYTATAFVSTPHTERVDWQYNRSSKLNGGTTSSSVTIRGNKTYTTTRKGITITAEEQFGAGPTFASTGSTNQTFDRSAPVISFKASAPNTRAVNTGSVTFRALYTTTYEVVEFASGQTTTSITRLIEAHQGGLYPFRYQVANISGIRLGSIIALAQSPSYEGGYVTKITGNYIETSAVLEDWFSSPALYNVDILFKNPSSVMSLPTDVVNTATYRLIGAPNANEFRFDFLPDYLNLADTFSLAGRTWPITNINTATTTLRTDPWIGLVDLESYIDTPVVFSTPYVDDYNPYYLVAVVSSNGNPIRGNGLNLYDVIAANPLAYSPNTPGAAVIDYSWIKLSLIPRDLQIGDYITPAQSNTGYVRWQIYDINFNFNMVKVYDMFRKTRTWTNYPSSPDGSMYTEVRPGGLLYSGSTEISRIVSNRVSRANPGSLLPNQSVLFFRDLSVNRVSYTTSTNYQSLTLGTSTTATFTGSAVEWKLNPSNLNLGTYYVSGEISTTLDNWDFPTIPKNSTSTWKLIVSAPPSTKIYGAFYAGTATETLTVYNYSTETFYQTVSFYEGQTFLGSANWNKNGNTQTSILTLGANTVVTATNLVAFWPGSTSTYRLNINSNKFQSETLQFVAKYDAKVTATNVIVAGSTSTSTIAYGQTFTATVRVNPISNDLIYDPVATGMVYLTSKVGTETNKLLTYNTLTSAQTVLTATNFAPSVDNFWYYHTATITAIYGGDSQHLATKSIIKTLNVTPGNIQNITLDPVSAINGQMLVKLGDFFMNGIRNTTGPTPDTNASIQFVFHVAMNPSTDIIFNSAVGDPGSYNLPYTSYFNGGGIGVSIGNTSTIVNGRLQLIPDELLSASSILYNQSTELSVSRSTISQNPRGYSILTIGAIYSAYYTGRTPSDIPISKTLPMFALITFDRNYYRQTTGLGPTNLTFPIPNGCAVRLLEAYPTAARGANAFTPSVMLQPTPF